MDDERDPESQDDGSDGPTGSSDPGGHDNPDDVDGSTRPDDRTEPSAESSTPEFDTFVLDESFIAAATIHEPSAVERTTDPDRYGDFEPRRLFITTSHSSSPGLTNPSDEPMPATFGPPGPLHTDELDEILHERSLRRRRRRSRMIRMVGILVVLAVAAVYGLDHFAAGLELLPWSRVNRALSGNEPPEGSTTPGPGDDTNGSDEDVGATPPIGTPEAEVQIIRGDNWPPAPANPSNERVLPAVVATTSGTHEFIMMQDDGSGPVAYDPCRPIRYVVSGASNAPLEGQALLNESIAVVSGLTGLAFVDEGASTERPSDTRRSYQPDRYGEQWAPVLIAWSDPTESPRLAENVEGSESSQMDVLGYAGSNAVGLRTVDRGDNSTTGSGGGSDGSTKGSTSGGPPDGMIFVTGGVTLDGPDFASLLQTPEGYEIARSAIMHELAHLVGLAHVDDPTQLMYPALQPGVTSFGAGDMQGLAAVGSGVCMPDI